MCVGGETECKKEMKLERKSEGRRKRRGLWREGHTMTTQFEHSCRRFRARHTHRERDFENQIRSDRFTRFGAGSKTR